MLSRDKCDINLIGLQLELFSVKSPQLRFITIIIIDETIFRAMFDLFILVPKKTMILY